jgi:hypothetical protein
MFLLSFSVKLFSVVFWQIKTDNLDHIWPIKMLRIIVVITITTLFPTFLELCLKPLNVCGPHKSTIILCFCVDAAILQCAFWSDSTPCAARYRKHIIQFKTSPSPSTTMSFSLRSCCFFLPFVSDLVLTRIAAPTLGHRFLFP